MYYKAFISYKHQRSPEFVRRLELALKKYAKPLLRPPIRIFRDENHLVPGTDLPDLIHHALNDSEYFILLASPGAAASPWVHDEIEAWFAKENRRDKFMIVLVEGQIAVDAQTQRIDWDSTDALPPALRTFLTSVPLYVDLSWAVNDTASDLSHAEFKAAVNRISARLHGIDPNEMLGVEVRQHRRNIRLRNSAVAALGALTIGVGVAGFVAYRNEQRANRERLLTVAQALATESIRLVRDEPGEDERAAILALHAYRFHHAHRGTRPQAVEDALRTVLSAPFFGIRIRADGVAFHSLDVSGDGRWVAAGSDDGLVHIWDQTVPSAPPVRLATNTGTPSTLSFGRDHRTLITGTHDGQLVVWRFTDRWQPYGDRSIRSDGRLESVAVSPSGARIAAAGPDGTVLVFSTEDLSRPPATLCCHRGDVLTISFGADDNTIASGGADRVVRVWDLRRPGPIHVLKGPAASVTTVAVSQTGRYVAAGTAIRPVNALAAVLAAAIRSDAVARTVDITGGDVMIWDMNQRQPTSRSLGAHESSVTAVRFRPFGDQLVSAAADSRILIWPASRSGRVDTLVGHRGLVSGVAFDSTGRTLVSVGRDDGTVRFWSLMPPVGLPVELVGHADLVPSIAFSPSGETIATAGSGDSSIRVWDLSRRDNPSVLPHEDATVVSVAFSDDGAWVATGSASATGSEPNNAVRLWRGGDWDAPVSIKRNYGSAVRALSFNHDRTILATAAELDQQIVLWTVGEELHEDTVHAVPYHVSALTFAPAGNLLAWGTGHGEVWTWDRDAGGPPRRFGRVHSGRVTAIAIDPLGETLVTSGEDSTAHIWSLTGARETPWILRGHTGAIRSIAIDPTGTVLATGSVDRTVRIWAAQEPLAKPTVLTVPWGVETVAFSPSGDWIGAAGTGASVMLWPRAAKLVREACALIRTDTLTQREWDYFVGPDIDQVGPCSD
jgi:WD40 repeat protein